MGCNDCGGNATSIAGKREKPVKKQPANKGGNPFDNKPKVKSTVVIRNGKPVT